MEKKYKTGNVKLKQILWLKKIYSLLRKWKTKPSNELIISFLKFPPSVF